MSVSVRQAIAVLDSGVGGLTVAREIMRQLPKEEIIYFGDTARAPYGPRTSSEVLDFTRQIVRFLLYYDPKMFVIACNTATAAALPYIREMVGVPVVGVIHPGARAAIKHSHTHRVGIIGTEGTIKSKAYEKALKEISPNMEVVSLACPSFVPIVEKGLYQSEEARATVRQTLQPLMETPMDCLILGCTHYPYLSGYISEVMGPSVKLISSAEETAREVSAILHEGGLQTKRNGAPEHRFYCSGETPLFRRIAQRWLGHPVTVTQVVWPLTQTTR